MIAELRTALANLEVARDDLEKGLDPRAAETADEAKQVLDKIGRTALEILEVLEK